MGAKNLPRDTAMSEEEEKKKKAQEGPQPISRREFALSSMVLLGAYSLAQNETAPPLSAEAQALKLEIANDVRDLMEARHILDDDIKRVIEHAERTGEKLYQPDTNYFLSKLWVQKAYFYVEYSPAKSGGYEVYTAYTHRFLLSEEPGGK